MTADDIRHWVDGYRAAWEHNDPTAIGALFAPDATYRTDPFAEPWSGRDGIVEAWLAARDEPGQTEFSYEVLAVDGDLGVVEGRTTYHDTSRTYANVARPPGRHRRLHQLHRVLDAAPGAVVTAAGPPRDAAPQHRAFWGGR